MPKVILSTDDAEKLTLEGAMKKLNTTSSGLTLDEAKKRLAIYGPNEISEKKVSPIVKLLKNFWGPIPWMLEAASILSIIIGHILDFSIITALLFVTAIVQFWQSNKADKAIELLKNKLAINARVYRDGKWEEMSSAKLVPGDIVRLKLGDIVPADLKLCKGKSLDIDQSALTGESMPVEKHKEDIAYSGSIVKRGEMEALVVSTGMNTYFGKTASLTGHIHDVSHFQKAVMKIGDYLIILTLALVVVIFVSMLLRGQSILNILQYALVLTVAGIPVAMPAVLSICMAVGAILLSKKQAIVSKLVAIEEMAGIDVLCSDKTGTITKNKISVADVVPFGDFTPDDVLIDAYLSSREEDKDPIDIAIIERSKKKDRVMDKIKTLKVVDYTPFDPVHKKTMAVVESQDGTKFKVSKGAPEVIVDLCGSDKDSGLSSKVSDKVDEMANKGYRALAVARADKNGKWQFVGLLSLHDPPRDDAKEIIDTAQDMGLEVKMVTGDHEAIAKEIAREIDLGTNILPASAIKGKSDLEVEELVDNANGFSEVFPEHKYRIVQLLQDQKHMVAMTGDGVNDVPALKKADAGIAVKGATDAAKSAAAIVLTGPGLSVIIDAIKESRQIFERMYSYSLYRMGETIRYIFFITAVILVFGVYPITALMIVLLPLVNDTLIMTIAYDRVRYRNEPERWNMRMLLSMATILGLIGVVSTFGIFFTGDLVFKLSMPVLQSLTYLKLATAGQLFLFSARTKGHLWTSRPANVLVGAIAVGQIIALALTVFGIFMSPIGWALAAFVWAWSIGEILVVDTVKVYLYEIFNHTGIKFSLTGEPPVRGRTVEEKESSRKFARKKTAMEKSGR